MKRENEKRSTSVQKRSVFHTHVFATNSPSGIDSDNFLGQETEIGFRNQTPTLISWFLCSIWRKQMLPILGFGYFHPFSRHSKKRAIVDNENVYPWYSHPAIRLSWVLSLVFSSQQKWNHKFDLLKQYSWLCGLSVMYTFVQFWSHSWIMSKHSSTKQSSSNILKKLYEKEVSHFYNVTKQ